MVVGLPGISWSPKKGVVGHLVRPSFAGLCILAQLNRPIVFWPKPTGISNIQCILSCYTWCLVFFLKMFLGPKFWYSRVVDSFFFTCLIYLNAAVNRIKLPVTLPETNSHRTWTYSFPKGKGSYWKPIHFQVRKCSFQGLKNCSSNGTYKKIETIVVVSQNGDVSSFRNILYGL